MQLTRMHLNPRRRQTMRFQRDPQALHAAVASAFPPGEDEARTLWRLDVDGHETTLLILSSRVPSLEHLQEQAGWQNEQTWESRDYGQLLARLMKGQRYAFRLAANPVHTVTGEDGKKRRLAHVSAPHQLGWLGERADLIGVRFLDEVGEPQAFPSPDDTHPLPLPGVRISERKTLKFRRGSQQVTLAQARFEGGIEVHDVDQLRNTLVQGIGKAKAYGCGLMTLAPLRSGAET
ncbi:MAG: type I-E CRISPR-associated protein Cas6/Cse3/CasE [Gulosibacter sp.]|uniref:type I-E CRISPR-associated protein Cas6/Cse3/CasE n=1 Tax=Gulosibacter sp. TaxID=2817531 RepID=UPI003F93765E